MKTILLFGASGAVGRFLKPLLTPKYRVIGVSRKPVDGPDSLQGDLSRTDFVWPQADIAVSAGPLDAFAYWLERNPQIPLQRIVALSSMSAESKQFSVNERERAVAQRLRDSEAKLFAIGTARHIAVTIFRPTMIYGAGIDRSLALIARKVKRQHWIPFVPGMTGLRQPVHAADLAGACASVLENAATFGKTYELGGGERLSLKEMTRRIRKCHASWSIPVWMPRSVLKIGARYAGFGDVVDGMIARLKVSLVADNFAAERDFAYAPRQFIVGDVLPVTKTQP
jgi:nucleoside-diphosphate-sugar epimerase